MKKQGEENQEVATASSNTQLKDDDKKDPVEPQPNGGLV